MKVLKDNAILNSSIFGYYIFKSFYLKPLHTFLSIAYVFLDYST